MIKINLLPEELQQNNKKSEVDYKNFIFIIPVIFVALIIFHIYLLGVNIYDSRQFGILNNKWTELEPKRKILENVKKEFNIIAQDSTLIQQLVKDRVTWAKLLNILSFKLPSGVWFNEFSLAGKEWILKGAIISLEKQELALVNKFLSSLKEDNEFFSNFSTLNLGTIQREAIGGYEVINFTLNGVLK